MISFSHNSDFGIHTDGTIYKVDWEPEPDLQKSGPWTFRKNGSYPKIYCTGQKFRLDKLEEAYFKYDNNFLKLQPKTHPDRSQIKYFFIFARNFAT